MSKTRTELLHTALVRAKKRWSDHLEPVRKAAIKVMPELGMGGKQVNGSIVPQPQFSCTVTDEDLYVHAEISVTSSQLGIRHCLEFWLPVWMVDQQDTRVIVRSIRRQQLEKR